MVTADPSQDYYADLELSPDCTTEDVKKAYRRLALQLHPDRHPGHEAEYNTKFQAISAAHDVLMDPERRAKYDVNRRRGNVNSNSFPRPPPPRRTAPKNESASNYPPPPRRTGPRSSSGVPPSASSGAERYAHFGTPPRPHRQSHSKTASDKAAGFKAWQHMNATFNSHKAQPPQGQRYNVPPPYQGPRRDPADFPDEGPFGRNRKGSDSSPPRSAFAESRRPRPNLNPKESSNRVPRRSGFDPTCSEDEGPAPASKYRRSFSNRESPIPTPPNGFAGPPPPPRSAGPNSRQQDHHDPARNGSGDEFPFTEGEARTSTPYLSHRKDRTYLSGETLRRSASTRDAAGLNHSPERAGRQSYFGSNERHRSASPMSSTVSSGLSPGEQRPRPSGRQRPFKPFISYSSSEESEDLEPFGQPKTHPHKAGESLSAVSSDISTDSKDEDEPSNRPKKTPSAAWAQRSGRAPMNKSRSFDSDRTDLNGQHRDGKAPDVKGTKPLSSAPLDQIASEHPSSSHSKQTVYGESGANDAAVKEAQSQTTPREPIRVQSSPDVRSAVDDEPQNLQINSGEAASSIAPEKSSHDNAAAATQGSSTSDWAEKWTKNLQEENWASKWATPSTQVPSRSGSMLRASIRRKPGAHPTGETKSATVEDVTAGTEDSSQREADKKDLYDQIVVEEDPMDVDTPSEPKETHQSSSKGNMEIDAGRMHTPTEPNRTEYISRQPSDSEALPRPNPMPAPPPPPRRASPGFIMNSLRHVEPFDVKAAGGGLHGMSELASDLPFESKPSSQHPLRAASNGNESEFEYVKPPKTPLQPQKLTQTSWQFHLSAMSSYISKWTAWNARMVSYFQDSAVRQSEMERGEGMVKQWLSAVGETGELGGWNTYVAQMEKDDKMRTRWKVASDKHWKALDMHTKLRNQIINSGLPP